jgi:predicted metal-dependent peptidase
MFNFHHTGEIMSYDLNIDIARLLKDEPFFAALSRRIEKISTSSIPTAAVGLNREAMQYEFLYNPDFFDKLTERQRRGVIIHEFYHLVFRHVSNRRPPQVIREPDKYFKFWNIAADLSINCLIGAENLPENSCIPGGKKFEDFPSMESAEFYFRKILEKIEFSEDSNGQGGQGEGQFDDCGQFDQHDNWAEGSGDGIEAETANERVKEYLKEAAEKADQKGWGNVSMRTREEVRKLLESYVDWRKVLRMFIGRAQRADKSNTRRRIDKRTHAYAQGINVVSVNPGRKVDKIANIAISIDQSGSVNDDLLAAFYAELNSLSKMATFTVIPFDDQVFQEKVFVWKKGDKRAKERVLCGGTNFSAPTKYVNERKFDGHIVLTDMMAEKPIVSKCQRMWMTSSRYAKNPYFDPRPSEMMIVVEERKAK